MAAAEHCASLTVLAASARPAQPPYDPTHISDPNY